MELPKKTVKAGKSSSKSTEEGFIIDSNDMIGKRRIIVVKELPLVDQQLNSQIPKKFKGRPKSQPKSQAQKSKTQPKPQPETETEVAEVDSTKGNSPTIQHVLIIDDLGGKEFVDSKRDFNNGIVIRSISLSSQFQHELANEKSKKPLDVLIAEEVGLSKANIEDDEDVKGKLQKSLETLEIEYDTTDLDKSVNLESDSTLCNCDFYFSRV
ncbi:hypothetical protein LXL04_002420 [Taraxacum kok-saghyz]